MQRDYYEIVKKLLFPKKTEKRKMRMRNNANKILNGIGQGFCKKNLSLKVNCDQNCFYKIYYNLEELRCVG
jgi:hypothetical protein